MDELQTFIATEFDIDTGRMYSREVRAYDWDAAQFICTALGWTLDGLKTSEDDE